MSRHFRDSVLRRFLLLAAVAAWHEALTLVLTFALLVNLMMGSDAAKEREAFVPVAGKV